MFCPNCGKQLPDQARFCGYCGTQLGTPSADTLNAQAPQDIPPVQPEAQPGPAPQPAPEFVNKLKNIQAPKVNVNVQKDDFKPLLKVLKDPFKEVELSTVPTACIAVLTLIINSWFFRAVFSYLLSGSVKLLKTITKALQNVGSAMGSYGGDMEDLAELISEINSYKSYLMDMIPFGSILLRGLLTTLLVFVILAIVQVIKIMLKKEAINPKKVLSGAARMILVPSLFVLLASLFAAIPTIATVMLFAAAIILTAEVVHELKDLQTYAGILIGAVVLLLVVSLFGRGFLAVAMDMVKQAMSAFGDSYYGW